MHIIPHIHCGPQAVGSDAAALLPPLHLFHGDQDKVRLRCGGAALPGVLQASASYGHSISILTIIVINDITILWSYHSAIRCFHDD